MYTTDGQRLIDFYGGHAVASLGYAHPLLTGALACQAGELFFQTNLVDVPIRRRAHQALVEFAPPGLEHAFLVNSGAEANENALRLAFVQRPGRTKVVCLKALSTVVPRPRAR
ncbi:MAG: aminotransferase class III-fold pyridoxal phosphate-dependent enzyme [Planctomycetota bacterium]